MHAKSFVMGVVITLMASGLFYLVACAPIPPARLGSTSGEVQLGPVTDFCTGANGQGVIYKPPTLETNGGVSMSYLDRFGNIVLASWTPDGTAGDYKVSRIIWKSNLTCAGK